MGESYITDGQFGKYVLVRVVDSTVELTVENNVYSLSESVELEQDLQRALYELRKNNILKEGLKSCQVADNVYLVFLRFQLQLVHVFIR